MATDGKNIYWAETMTGKVRSAPVAGGAIADVATAQLSPTQIAVDDTGVYWLSQGDGTAKSSTVQKKALTAAPADKPTLVVASKDMTKLPGMTVHKGLVYYSEATNVHQIGLDSKDIIVGIAVNYDDGKMDVLGSPVGIAASDDHVVWTTPLDRLGVESHTLMPVTNATDNKPGYGKLGKSVGSLLPAGAVALDAMFGYWIDGQKVERGPLASTNGVYDTVTAAPSGAFTAFAISPTKLYASGDAGEIFEHSLVPPADPANDTAPALPIARDQMAVSSVVVDATKVYWITGDCVISSEPL
jgi:hypothetical protein